MRSYATLSKCRSPATSGACEGNEGALLLRTAHREILGELLMKYFLHDRPPACARRWRVRTPELACARPGCQRRGGARGGDPDIRRNHLFDAWAPGPLARFHAQDSVGPGRSTRSKNGDAAVPVAPITRPPRRSPPGRPCWWRPARGRPGAAPTRARRLRRSAPPRSPAPRGRRPRGWRRRAPSGGPPPRGLPAKP